MVAAAIIAIGALTALLVNIFERKQEARNPFFRVVELNDETEDPEIWGKNFPMQYDGYKRTVDQVRTRFGGSEALPHTPTEADPRTVVAQSKIEEDPRLKTMWAGYAFATTSARSAATPTCSRTRPSPSASRIQAARHLPPLPRLDLRAYKKAGDGDLIKGFEKINQMPYAEARKSFKHPIACIDCHDPQTMALRVTRPGFIEGIGRSRRARASRTTTSTPWRRARRCAPSSAASATSSTTSRAPRSGSPTPGTRA